MHIADGIINVEICLAADVLAMGALFALGRKTDPDDVPRMGLTAAALFTVSLIHFPVAGTSIHLGLFGLAGILLGKRVFPVVFATSLFQSLLFQHGGLLSVGINALNMGSGAMLGWFIWKSSVFPVSIRSFGAGFVGIMLPAVLMALEFELSGYGKGIFYILYVYMVVGTVEGVLTMVMVRFFKRVSPGILEIG